MASFHALATPFAMVLPLLGQTSDPSALAEMARAAPVAAQANVSEAPLRLAPGYCSKDQSGQAADVAEPVAEISNPLNAIHRSQITNQIRVQSRVIIRISPQRPAERNSLFANLPRQSLNARYEERKMDRCIPVSDIAGVQTGSGNQLLLFLRDRRIIRLNLEKACRARDFYSGFYVEKSKDGKLCVSRDKLQSRTGANCEVARMRQLVAVTK